MLDDSGAYMVTAGTYRKEPLFRSAKRLAFLCEQLLDLAAMHNWKMEAWAVFPNHYHFVAIAKEKAENLPRFIGHLHMVTAKEINGQDQTPGRKVWFPYWDSRLSYPQSYLARLNYVHCNAVKHKLVRESSQYPWCSAGWFEREATKPFYQTVMRMRSDRVNVSDDFEVNTAEIE